MAHPFLYLTLALASGITLSALISIGISVVMPLLIVQIFVTWLLFIRRKTGASFLGLLIFILIFGYAHHQNCEKEYASNGLHRLKKDAYVDFMGKLFRSPGRGYDKDRLYLKVSEVRKDNESLKIRGRLRVSVAHSAEFPGATEWSVNDKIKVSAKLNSARGFHNFHPSPIARFYRSQGIHNLAYTKSPLLVEKLKDAPPLSPLHIISVIRQKLQKKMELHFKIPEGRISTQGAILEALMLGERGRLPEEAVLSLQKSGIYHLFAISGAHIAIISFLLFSVFRLLRLSRRHSFFILIGVLFFYALLVEGRPSVLRAVTMAIFFLAGKLMWKDINLLNTLSLSAFFLLLMNPCSLFAPGFQLTFAATLTIILFYPRVIKKLPRLPLKISEVFALSLTAQLGVLPIIASAFNRVSFSAFLLNYAAIPLVALIMSLGYIFLALSFLSCFFSGQLVLLLNRIIDLLLDVSGILNPVSFLSFRIPDPHPWVLTGYFFFLFLFLVPIRKKALRAATSTGFLAFFFILITHPFPVHTRNLRITYIDVGQGDAILIEFPGKEKMLIDGGGTRDNVFDIGENVLCPFLWHKGIKKIDTMVLTHAHPDHLNGLKAVARNFPVSHFWEGISPLHIESYDQLLASLSSRTTRRRMSRCQSVAKGEVQIHVAHPPQSHPVTAPVHNNHSLVLRIAYGCRSFVFTGDIENEVEKSILENGVTISGTVLKSPHHGSLTSSSIPFLRKVAPEIVVVSAGQGNRYGLPHPEVIERYGRIGARVYRTDIHGAVEITTDGQNLSVRTALPSREESPPVREGRRAHRVFESPVGTAPMNRPMAPSQMDGIRFRMKGMTP